MIGDRGRQADRAGDRQRLQAEALADPTRFAAYQHIRRTGQPLSVAEITDAVGVHHTAVRAHLTKLRDAGFLTPEDAGTLIDAAGLEHALTQVLRVALDETPKMEEATPGLKALLRRTASAPDFAALEGRLFGLQRAVRGIFEKVMA